MINGYRKRAEEFISGWDVWDFPGEGEKLVKMLEQAFFEVAQEARREENEACLEIIEYYKKNFNNFNVEDLLESIRSRWRESD